MRNFLKSGSERFDPSAMFEGTDTPALWKLAETADKVRPLQEIDRLSEQVDYWRKKAQSLERELHKEVRTARERPFGNDTPSSK